MFSFKWNFSLIMIVVSGLYTVSLHSAERAHRARTVSAHERVLFGDNNLDDWTSEIKRLKIDELPGFIQSLDDFSVRSSVPGGRQVHYLQVTNCHDKSSCVSRSVCELSTTLAMSNVAVNRDYLRSVALSRRPCCRNAVVLSLKPRLVGRIGRAKEHVFNTISCLPDVRYQGNRILPEELLYIVMEYYMH